MDSEDHRARHEMLHRYLDELIADFISHTGSMPSKTTLMQFMVWSYGQTESPTTTENDHVTK